jgi:hypothetical protein
MKHKVAELEGALLDAAVALAEGRLGGEVRMWGDVPFIEGGGVGQSGSNVTAWSPSINWLQGGPIIERELICLDWGGDAWHAFFDVKGRWPEMDIRNNEQKGSTPLIAAMRAYVASKLGEEVDLP